MQSEPDKSPFRVVPLPRPRPKDQERRQRRSTSVAEALELALSGAANRGSLDAVLIVDADGMLVAKNRTGLDLAMLAAVTPIVGRGKALANIKRNGRSLDFTVRPVTVGDEILYVGALGGTFGARQRELVTGAAATRRILD